MDYSVLRAELELDPLTRGYSGMSDSEAADDLNTVYRNRNRSTMSATEVINLIDADEWAGRTAEQKETVWNLVHMGTVNPWGVEATMFQAAMAGCTVTLAALAAARVESISRAAELGLGLVKAGDIAAALSNDWSY